MRKILACRTIVFLLFLSLGCVLGLITSIPSFFTLDDIAYYSATAASFVVLVAAFFIYRARFFWIKVAITPMFISAIIYNVYSIFIGSNGNIDSICQTLDAVGWIFIFGYLFKITRGVNWYAKTSEKEKRPDETRQEMRLV